MTAQPLHYRTAADRERDIQGAAKRIADARLAKAGKLAAILRAAGVDAELAGSLDCDSDLARDAAAVAEVVALPTPECWALVVQMLQIIEATPGRTP